MKYKLALVGLACLCIILCSLVHIGAQGAPQDAAALMLEHLEKIARKVDLLAAGSGNAQTAQKLDMILNNQERILKELEIVKVRATQR